MKNRNWFWGLIFLLSGVVVVASQLVSFGQIGIWTIIAAVLLGAVFINSLIRLSFFGMLMSAALFYTLFQEPFGWVAISPWLLILAAVLMSSGLSMLFHRKPQWVYGWGQSHHGGYGNWQGYQPQGGNVEMLQEGNEDDNHPYIKVSFGEASKYLHSTCLQDGQFYASFGTLEVYFDQAILSPEGATVYLDCSFGGIRLYVPRHWKVKEQLSSSLGGVNFDSKQSTADENSPVLTVTGKVSLGGIDIYYV